MLLLGGDDQTGQTDVCGEVGGSERGGSIGSITLARLGRHCSSTHTVYGFRQCEMTFMHFGCLFCQSSFFINSEHLHTFFVFTFAHAKEEKREINKGSSNKGSINMNRLKFFVFCT